MAHPQSDKTVMNAHHRFATSFFVASSLLVSPVFGAPPSRLPEITKFHPLKVVPLTDHSQVLAQIPESLRSIPPKAWTGLQRNAVNAKLKAALGDTLTPVDLKLEVKDVGDWWGSLIVLSEIPNQEGYPIAVFGKYSPNWKSKLETLKRGDSIQLKGTVLGVTYKEHHGVFTLCIDVESTTPPN